MPVTLPSNTARTIAPALVWISIPLLSMVTFATGCLCGPKYPVIVPRSTGHGSRPRFAANEFDNAWASGVRLRLTGADVGRLGRTAALPAPAAGVGVLDVIGRGAPSLVFAGSRADDPV